MRKPCSLDVDRLNHRTNGRDIRVTPEDCFSWLYDRLLYNLYMYNIPSYLDFYPWPGLDYWLILIARVVEPSYLKLTEAKLPFFSQRLRLPAIRWLNYQRTMTNFENSVMNRKWIDPGLGYRYFETPQTPIELSEQSAWLTMASWCREELWSLFQYHFSMQHLVCD